MGARLGQRDQGGGWDSSWVEEERLDWGSGCRGGEERVEGPRRDTSWELVPRVGPALILALARYPAPKPHVSMTNITDHTLSICNQFTYQNADPIQISGASKPACMFGMFYNKICFKGRLNENYKHGC